MLLLVNLERRHLGLPALVHDPSLASVARMHSRDMAANGVVSHEFGAGGSLGERLDRAAYGHRMARENVGRAPSMEAAQRGFRNSEKHRTNLLSADVTHAGIGIIAGEWNALPALYITQVFAQPIAPREPDELRGAFLLAVEEIRRAGALDPVQVDPLLENLANLHLAGLSGLPDQATLKRVLSEAVRQARREGVRDVTSMALDVQLLRDESDLRIPGQLRQARARTLGTAALKVHDARNRPRVVMLSFVGLGS